MNKLQKEAPSIKKYQEQNLTQIKKGSILHHTLSLNCYICITIKIFLQLNLVIDQGNSFTKAGVFDQRELIYFDSFKILDKEKIELLQKQYAIDKFILSSVSDEGTNLFDALKKRIEKGLYLDETTKLTFTNNYETPATLGKDRLAAVAGAIDKYNESNILVIDAGTAITYELITEGKQYQGGNIAPGLTMRFKALNQFTKKLPMCNAQETFPMIGTTTQTAIVAGVQNSLIFEIDGYIDTLKQQYEHLMVIITGGDANFFVKKLKNTIFVDQNIVLTGLNSLLEYNLQ